MGDRHGKFWMYRTAAGAWYVSLNPPVPSPEFYDAIPVHDHAAYTEIKARIEGSKKERPRPKPPNVIDFKAAKARRTK